MNPNFIHNKFDKWTVIEFRTPNLMDPIALESIQADLVRLVEVEDRRHVILDFESVQYVSSQAIGIVIGLNRRLSALPNSRFLLCGINGKLTELLRITRLDRVLKIKPTQKEAVNSLAVL